MTEHAHTESINVACSPQVLYDIVSDVTRTGEWSPICTSCWWDDGAGPSVGSWFTGHNETPERTWETRSQVTVAEPGRKFAFEVGQGFVRWAFSFTPVEGGTEATESWQFLPAGLAMFRARYGEAAQDQIADRTDAAHRGIPLTLAAIKRIAEAGAAPRD